MIAAHKGEIPVVILLLPFMAGIVGGLYLSQIPAWYIGSVLFFLCLFFAFFNLFYRRFNIYKLRWLGGIIMYPALFLMGWLLTIQHNELNNSDHFSRQKAQLLVARINSEPTVKGDWTRFTATVIGTINNSKAQKASGSILIAIKDELARNMFYGEEIVIPAKYALIDPPFNPGEFNYKQYLARKNVYYQQYLFPGQYKITGSGQGNQVIAYALQTRQNLVKKLYTNMHDSTAIAVASTLILGYKADLSDDVMQAYSKTGTIHILSVSGGHVAIIYALLAGILAFMPHKRRIKIWRSIIIITLVWVYALLTGFSPAVCRAALMISFAIIGRASGRYVNPLNILACSALLLLLYDPLLLTDVGFQLSYLAVAGLIVFEPIVYRLLTVKNKTLDYLWKACSVSIAAQVITFPLSAYYFHQFPVYFLVSNLLIILPVAVIIYSGLALLVFSNVPVISNVLSVILENSILLMNKCLTYIEHAPYASISKIWLTKFEHLLLYIMIITFFYWLYNKNRKQLLYTSLFAMLVFAGSISLKKLSMDKQSSITFLNLRKHTGIVFKNGDKGIVITDVADTDKVFRYSIQPGLDSMRITDYHVYLPGANIKEPFLQKHDGLIQFERRTLLLLNQSGYLQSIPQRLQIDYLYVSGNAPVDTNSIKNRMVILGADNSDRYIERIKNIPVNCTVLKRNKSVTILSNW